MWVEGPGITRRFGPSAGRRRQVTESKDDDAAAAGREDGDGSLLSFFS